jgi:predicted NACHT family NTPase
MVHTEEITKKTLDNITIKRNQSDLQLYLINQLDETIIEIQKLNELSDIDMSCLKQMSSLFYRKNFLKNQLDNLENN